MSAVARQIDISPEREISIPLTFGNWSLDVLVRYTVSYASRWHRGHGVDPDISVIAVTYEDGVELKELTLLPGMHDQICLQIEAEELQD